MANQAPQIRMSRLGDSALLLDAAAAQFDDAVQSRIWSVSRSALALDHVLETVPGMNNLMVVFDPLSASSADLRNQLTDLWQADDPAPVEGRLIEVPVTYGGATGEDLAALAAAKSISIAQLVALHTQPIYTVAAVGAMPGFVYLSGLDPALFTPRRSSPRASVQKGSIIIGGSQAGIMPVTAPSGWHILGHTPLSLFDPQRDEPATFRPGDRIRFVPQEIRS